ncbi:MAG: peptide MFS transporter [Bacteroidota bacterium]|nr:peptide MFS transporter [Bacteroidota bacterium]MDW8137876.1 peptide MFS transporter [Bacteroidota bacterium]
MQTVRTATRPALEQDRAFFGHPKGLSTLFFTELWERFSYYGMRALLILFMTAPAAAGGLGFDVATAGAIYGLYTALVYMTGLPGGWIADRFLGARKAVLLGGIIIALGHYSMFLPALTDALGDLIPFYTGLALIIIGTGLLKPNISTMVGMLYSPEDIRRDAGFSIFYMGINLGAFVAPFVCGYLGQRIDWHYGFGAAGLGMTLGLIQYLVGGRYLGEAGLKPARAVDPAQQARDRRLLAGGLGGALGTVALAILLDRLGVWRLTIGGVTRAMGLVLLLVPLVYFGLLFLRGRWTAPERGRLAAVMVLFVFSALFWSAFEQAGSTLNLFADRYTNTVLFGFSFPSSWFQSVNAFFIIMLSGAFAALWLALARRGREPSSPVKFALGLFFVGLGFLVLVPAALLAQAGVKVSPMWLVFTYLCHTIGELCLSPVGLSTVTKLAPERVVGQMMGVWFLSISLGNFIGGQIAGLFERLPLPVLFLAVFGTTAGAAFLLLLLLRPIKRLMGAVR